MSGPWITTCLHGVDLRFTPRCYLCKPVAVEQEARRAAFEEAIAAVEQVFSITAVGGVTFGGPMLSRAAVIDALTRLRDGTDRA